jgi:hypothetical protein
MIKIGFTGTKRGMNQSQQNLVHDLLYKFNYIETSWLGKYKIFGHHGDCIGADTQFHDMLLKNNAYIVLHPPINDKYRAFNVSFNQIRNPKAYGIRDRDIVKECELLIATPRGFLEELRSGTWMTIRIARKIKRNTYIVFPDGSVKLEEYK